MQVKSVTYYFSTFYERPARSPGNGHLLRRQNASKPENDGDWKRRMVHRTLTCGVLGWCLSLLPQPASAQNAQCTILIGSNAGQVVPVTINPAPPLNAPCQVGGSRGYISRTSSGVGVNANAQCTIVVSRHPVAVPFEGNPAPALNAVCQIVGVNGYVSSTSAPTNISAQCTPLSGPNRGQGIPYSATPPPALKAPCKIGNYPGYISRTSAPPQPIYTY
jgi:hypothetical protein